MRVSQDCIYIIKEFEGFRSKAYRDLKGIPTIGYGFTKGVKMGDTMTMAQADIRLENELVEYSNAVLAATKNEVTQSQLDALTSLAWNIGIAGMRGSTVIKAHNRGDFQAAARAFALWNKAKINGELVTVAGLTRRRSAESALYLKDTVPVPLESYVEAEPERHMGQSQIVRASTVAGGTAAIGAVSETLRTVTDIKYNTAQLGDWLLPILLVAVVGLCGYIIWNRYKQRKDGWS